MPSSIKERFDQDKYFLIKQANEYLVNNKQEPLQTNRDELVKAVEEGNFTKALQNLEILREEKTGIKLTKIDPLIEGTTPVLIRDARNAKDPRVLGTEAFEMQYLNATRAAIDIAKIEGKPELEAQLKKEAKQFIVSFNPLNMKESQENISINVKNEINNIAILLEKNGIAEVHKKLNVAKDFQNLNDEHCNIVTVSNVKDKDGKDRAVIEAEVALKGITDEQKQEYQNRADKKWFTKMPSWEKGLVNKYAETIKEGEHVISTQLRQIVGMKNAFEKITAIANDNSELEIINNSKHAGTLVSFCHDKGSRQDITNLNAKQAQEWIGKDHILHTNTLNSGPANIPFPSVHMDVDIVKGTNLAMQTVGGKNTNTAFNKFRKIAAFNNFNGTKDQLNDIANSLPKEGNFSIIASHLRPRSKLERLLGINKPKGDLQGLLDIAVRTHNLSPEAVEIINNAADLKKDIEKADVIFLRGADKENINLDISTKLNHLNNKILNSDPNDQILNKITKYEDLTMCASGKDRTGLAEHDQSSSAIADKLGIDIREVDKQLLKGGHTAGQAGGVYAGGATVGCHGTLKVTNEGFPESRKDALKSIIEPTGANNKIKKLEKGQIINEPEEQKKAPETPNMYETASYKTMPASIQTPAANITTVKNAELNKSKQQTVIRKTEAEVKIGSKPLAPSVTPRSSQNNKDNNITR
ncbi:MAG TPA: hypothetical protein LFW21_01130 [Rickettsia endosymbiont of Pyrocoelia pectoralis]|nr:hypothetical protein [Rickettsia endosymbiont of Pyrocoelia pectoralis]